MSATAAPLLTRDEATQWAREQRAAGRSVVLANGCFDLLHTGHLRYLTEARAEGDRLIVGVNADASVARSKGAGRPLLSAEARARCIAALRCVDAVTIFEEPTADALIRLLRPAVHCKGADYAHGVPESSTVAAVGGRVAIVGGHKSHGTRDLIARIRGTGS